jgi:valyl-tRNA synthetase
MRASPLKPRLRNGFEKEGISRYDLGREGFLKEAWKWKDEYAKPSMNNGRNWGLSVDYTRERFTLDEGLSNAVKHVFVTLYNEGLIYQGERIINWDPELRTALSQHRSHPQRR